MDPVSLRLLAQSIPQPPSDWAPILLMILIAVAFAGGSIIMSLVLGPRRRGPVKDMTYESGMVPVGDARGRFNVRFYLMAMIFLVFDVEIVFFYPWATLFPRASAAGDPASGMLLVGMLVFVLILLVAYLYAWGKGVFDWD